MKRLGTIILTLASSGLVIALAACSEEPEPKAAPKKQGATAACEHLNDICANTPGFQSGDCAATNAAYERLTDAQKAQADMSLPCVIAATTCDAALACVRPKSNSSTTSNGAPASSNDTDPEAACEHINDVCTGEPGFKTQDCSGSAAAYAALSAEDKALANQIAPCITGSSTCSGAFKCLGVE